MALRKFQKIHTGNDPLDRVQQNIADVMGSMSSQLDGHNTSITKVINEVGGLNSLFYYQPLRASSPNGQRDIRFVDGFAKSGDGGGGNFIWNPTDVRPDDNGTIIQVTGISTGRWNRVYTGHLDIRWFGADQTGTLDSTTAIQAALNVASGSLFSTARRVYAPTGLYLFSSLITIPAYVEFYGDPSNYLGPGAYNSGQFGTVFRWTGGTGTATAMQFQIFTGISQGIYCHDFILHGNFGLSGGIANSVTGLLIAGAPGKELTICKLDRVTIAEFNICCQWGNDGISQADSIQWEHCHFAYFNQAGLIIDSANAADASEMKNCFWVGTLSGLETTAIGIDLVRYGLLKLSHCQGDVLNEWIHHTPGNTLILENCETEDCNYFLNSPTGGDDSYPIVLIANTINNPLTITSGVRVVAMGNNLTGFNFAGVYQGVTLGTSTRWVGRGNRFIPPCPINLQVSTSYDEDDMQHAEGLYDGEYHGQGQTMVRPGPMYALGGTIDSFAYREMCVRSGNRGTPWTANTVPNSGVSQLNIAVPDNGHAFYCESIGSAPNKSGVSQPTWAFGITTVASGSIPGSLPAAGGILYAASTSPAAGGFASSGKLYVGTSAGNELVTYTGISGNTFTGCTGGTGTLSLGGPIRAATTDGNLIWGDLDGGSSLHDLVGVPGQCRYDGVPSFYARKGTHAFSRSTVATGNAQGLVAIQDTSGGVSSQWRNFGETWGNDDGVTAGNYTHPMNGSALDAAPWAWGTNIVTMGSVTTYDLTAADAASPCLSLSSTAGSPITVVFPASLSAQFSIFRVFNDSGQTMTLEATGGGVTNVTLLAGCSVTIVVGGTLVVTLDSAMSAINGGVGLLSFYGATPIAQQTDVGVLTDTSGGSPSFTVPTVGGAFNTATLDNIIISLVNQINSLRLRLHNLGLTA